MKLRRAKNCAIFGGHPVRVPVIRPLTHISRDALRLYLVDGKLVTNIHHVSENH